MLMYKFSTSKELKIHHLPEFERQHEQKRRRMPIELCLSLWPLREISECPSRSATSSRFLAALQGFTSAYDDPSQPAVGCYGEVYCVGETY